MNSHNLQQPLLSDAWIVDINNEPETLALRTETITELTTVEKNLQLCVGIFQRNILLKQTSPRILFHAVMWTAVAYSIYQNARKALAFRPEMDSADAEGILLLIFFIVNILKLFKVYRRADGILSLRRDLVLNRLYETGTHRSAWS